MSATESESPDERFFSASLVHSQFQRGPLSMKLLDRSGSTDYVFREGSQCREL